MSSDPWIQTCWTPSLPGLFRPWSIKFFSCCLSPFDFSAPGNRKALMDLVGKHDESSLCVRSKVQTRYFIFILPLQSRKLRSCKLLRCTQEEVVCKHLHGELVCDLLLTGWGLKVKDWIPIPKPTSFVWFLGCQLTSPHSIIKEIKILVSLHHAPPRVGWGVKYEAITKGILRERPSKLIVVIVINKWPLLNCFQKTLGARGCPATLLARIPKTICGKYVLQSTYPWHEHKLLFSPRKLNQKRNRDRERGEEGGKDHTSSKQLSIRAMISISKATIPFQGTWPLPWRTTAISSLISWLFVLTWGPIHSPHSSQWGHSQTQLHYIVASVARWCL